MKMTAAMLIMFVNSLVNDSTSVKVLDTETIIVISTFNKAEADSVSNGLKDGAKALNEYHYNKSNNLITKNPVK